MFSLSLPAAPPPALRILGCARRGAGGGVKTTSTHTLTFHYHSQPFAPFFPNFSLPLVGFFRLLLRPMHPPPCFALIDADDNIARARTASLGHKLLPITVRKSLSPPPPPTRALVGSVGVALEPPIVPRSVSAFRALSRTLACALAPSLFNCPPLSGPGITAAVAVALASLLLDRTSEAHDLGKKYA